MLCRAHAKINLSLRVVGKREDGFHDLESVMLPLELHDVVEIEREPRLVDTFITCNHPSLLTVKLNICAKAVAVLRQAYGFKDNFSIKVHKEIPAESGLGGGSSDAASTILAINHLLKLNLSEEELNEIGKQVGADVPFFFSSRPSLIEGIGEDVTPIEIKTPYHCLLVKPQQGLSTSSVFSLCDQFPKAELDNNALIQALKEDNEEEIEKHCLNDLTLPAASLIPQINDIIASLKEEFTIVSMSGSGSTVFALTKNYHHAKEAKHHYEKMGYQAILTKVIV